MIIFLSEFFHKYKKNQGINIEMNILINQSIVIFIIIINIKPNFI
jgi:hypothetical protein